VNILLKNGKTIEGIARNRSNYSLQVIDSRGALHLISMTDVKEIKVSDHSPMPDDYAKRLTRDEMRDLLAYLARQTARTPESIAAKETK
jgi:putative heme-binding domain-containing protein